MLLTYFRNKWAHKRQSLPSFVLAISLLVGTLQSVQAVVLAQGGGDPIPYPDLDDSIDAAVQWLVETHQNDDGGYSSFSQGTNLAPSDVSGTADALPAIAAAGGNVNEPLSYLKSQLSEMITFAEVDSSAAGKLVLALVAAGEDPRDFGHDFVGDILSHHSPDGHFGIESAFGHSMAILGLAAAGEPIPDSSISWLHDRQEEEGDLAGSWDDGFGTAGNPDATAAAARALIAGGVEVEEEALSKAVSFFDRAQLPSGGWEYGQGFGENANSTALVIRALQSAGDDPKDPESDYAQNGRSPVEVLMGWQSASGAFQADFGNGPADDFFATVQSLPALTDVQAHSSNSDSNAFGGDSALPFWLLGILAVVFFSLVIWYLRAKRRNP